MPEYVVTGTRESYLGNKTLVGTWTIIGESGLVQLLRNVDKRRTPHESRRCTFKHSKHSISTFFLIFYKFSNHLF